MSNSKTHVTICGATEANVRQRLVRKLRPLVEVILMLTSLVASTTSATAQAGGGIPDAPPVGIGEPLSDALLEDLATIADQKGISVREAISRYGWHNDFLLLAGQIRAASPDSFTGSGIDEGKTAWIGFSGRIPRKALDLLEQSAGVIDTNIVFKPNLGFNEYQLNQLIQTTHLRTLELDFVNDAMTSYDFESKSLTIVVLTKAGIGNAELSQLNNIALPSLSDLGITTNVPVALSHSVGTKLTSW